MYAPLTEPVEVWHFDLRTPPEESDRKSIDLHFDSDGRMNGVAFWFKLQLTDGIEFSTGPEAVAAGQSRHFEACAIQKTSPFDGDCQPGCTKIEPGRRLCNLVLCVLNQRRSVPGIQWLIAFSALSTQAGCCFSIANWNAVSRFSKGEDGQESLIVGVVQA